MKQVVILVGMPGAGKTHYCRTVLPDHVRISQDEGPRHFKGVLGRYQRLLTEGVERIVIDRTNPMRSQRAHFTELARVHGYRVRIVHLDVPRAVCEQRILGRKDHPTLDGRRMAEAINRYQSCLEAPVAEECDELVVLGQVP